MSTPKELRIKVALKMQKPASEVFEAIVDPERMSNYFISKSTGRMEEGKTITWKFPEFDMEFPVRVERADPDDFISWYWDDMNGNQTMVEISLKAVNGEETFVSITEGTRENNEQGLKWLQSNTEGWANFLASLKAYLEYGINLRQGAFDISQMPTKEVTSNQ
jgi:uncharacterized protein YndB with AHSA1/START domain